ncbi:MAG: cysteine desulfurase / selenocysteine lyase [Thermomicrobiales bacterium]|jgi:cysteine desulfurase/selenocysteine lyase|nr:cysteine desulfurase / selenocysteine lyase [Thermomicrobiales bacterium]
MSITTNQPTTPLDAAAIRADFPILNQPLAPDQLSLVFLDSAASSQKPAAVIDALDDYYRRYNANIHRGVYHLSELATSKYEEARHLVAAFVNAASPNECIFVRNTTEAINLVAQTWGRRNLKEGDLVLLTVMEHHSNLVPWHLLAEEKGFEIAYVPLTPDQRLDMAAFDELVKREPKLVGVAHVSNGVGTVNDVATIAAKAHAAGALVLVDGAQSVPHLPVDVQALDLDFLAFSGHKMLGPMGSGVLYGKKRLLDAMPPFMGGGGMIRKVTLEGSTYGDVPARFEAGTPAVGEAIGLGVAVEYLSQLGMDRIITHERELIAYALDRLTEVPGLTVYGPTDPAHRSGVVSFTLGDIHPHDVAAILDGENVAVRAGHHCNQPLVRSLGLVATTRASFYVYNTPDDADRLVAALHKANKVFGLE